MKLFQALKTLHSLRRPRLDRPCHGLWGKRMGVAVVSSSTLDPYPALTNQALLTVTGSKDSGTAIRYQKGSQDAVVAVEANEYKF